MASESKSKASREKTEKSQDARRKTTAKITRRGDPLARDQPQEGRK